MNHSFHYVPSLILGKNFSLETMSPWQNRVFIIALLWVFFLICFCIYNYFLYILVTIDIYSLVSVIVIFYFTSSPNFYELLLFPCSYFYQNVSLFFSAIIQMFLCVFHIGNYIFCSYSKFNVIISTKRLNEFIIFNLQ